MKYFVVLMIICLYLFCPANRAHSKGTDPGGDVFTLSGRHLVALIEDKDMGDDNIYAVKDTCEFGFKNPCDFEKKFLKFKIKGSSGEEHVKVILWDNTTRRSPDFYLGGIGKDWKTVSIGVEEAAFDFMDTTHVEKIRFEVFVTNKMEDDSRPSIFIKEIEVI